MEKLLLQLVEEAKKDKARFESLKRTVVKCQQFELASNLRQIEKDLFPESNEDKVNKEYAASIVALMSMVNLKIDLETAFIVSEAIKVYGKKKGKFDLHDASAIQEKKDKLFPNY